MRDRSTRARNARSARCEPFEARRLLTSVVSHSFDPDALPHHFGFMFDTGVGASLDDSDIAIENLTTSERLFTGLSWGYDSANDRLNIAPATSAGSPILPNGNYEVFLRADGIHDGANPANYLTSDYRADFFFLNGDFDRDRDVDAADLAILTANTGTGTLWSQGDADGDMDVDADDLAIVQSAFGAQLPPPPQFPGQVNTYALGPNTVTVEWATPNYPVAGYRIYQSFDGFAYDMVDQVSDPQATSWSDDLLLDGEFVWYRVRAVTPDGATQAMQADSALTLLQAPTDLTAELWDDDLNITWAVSSAGHDELVLQKKVDIGDWETLAVLDGSTAEYMVESVADGHLYDLRIWAVQNDAGGAVLQTSAPAVLTEPLNYPHEAPGDVNVVVTSSTTALVSWTDWSDSETGYQVDRKAVGSSTWTTRGTTASSVTSFSDTSLAANTDYEYRVTTLGAGTQSSTQAGAVANSAQSSEARPAPGQVGYVNDFNNAPPSGGWPGWSSSEHVEGALGEFDMDQTITFTLGELIPHSHIATDIPHVSFRRGNDVQPGQRYTLTVRVGQEVLYRRHMDVIDGQGGIGHVSTTERVSISETGLFEHSEERIRFTFEPSIGVTPGGGGGGGGPPIGPPIGPDEFGGDGLDGFGVGGGGGGIEDPPGGEDPPPPPDPTTWIIGFFNATPMISTVTMGVSGAASEVPTEPGNPDRPAPFYFAFGRTAGVLLDFPLTIEYQLDFADARFRADFGSDFELDPDHFVDLDFDGINDNIGGLAGLTFPAGRRVAAVALRPIDDEALEPHEYVWMNLRPGGSAYRVGDHEATATPLLQRQGRTLKTALQDDEVRIYLFAGNRGSGGTVDTNDDGEIDDFDINTSQGIWILLGMLRGHNRLDDSEVRAFSSETGSVWDWSRNGAENHALKHIERDIRRAANRPLGIAMAGYSWGGGMLADITQRLARRRGIGPYWLGVTAYIDAIDHRTHDWLRVDRDFVAPSEGSMPERTQRHLNFYQSMDDPDTPPGGNQKSNYPNGSWSGPGFISVNMDVNAAVRNSPNVGRSLFANDDPALGVIERVVVDPLPESDANNRFTHTTIDKQEPILKEIQEWFVNDLL